MRRPPRGYTDSFRIIGGRHRGRRLGFPPLPGLRPTPDRVRQTLFDWLAPRIEGASVLDLFAGSGALGFEALSRGASTVDFVERAAAQAANLRKTLAQFGAVNQARVLCQDALSYLATADALTRYDLVLIDPPYAAALIEPVLPLLPRLLKADSRIYLEWPGSARPGVPAPYQWLREKQAGQVSFGLLTYRPDL